MSQKDTDVGTQNNDIAEILGIARTPKVFSEVMNYIINSYVDVNRYVEKYLRCVIEDAWLYHKSVQFDAYSIDLISSLASPLEYFIDRVKLERHISSPTLSIHEFYCAHTNKRILYWDDDAHMLYKGTERMSLKQMKAQTGFASSVEEYANAVDAGVRRGMHQLVQFLKSYKEAPQMRILSKTWKQAWLTLSNLEFRVEYMSRGSVIVDTIMERYRDDKIPIDKFEFSNYSGSNDNDLFFIRINTWLDMALQNGVKDIIYENPYYWTRSYPFPIINVLAGKCLRELVLRGDCNLMDVSLSSDENMLQTLLSSCPLIVSFNLDDCQGLGKIELLNLQKIKLISMKGVRNMHVKNKAPTLEHFSFSSYSSSENLDVVECQKLKSLELKYVRISDGSLENLISRSQSLKVLMIQKCPGIRNIDSSNLVSLEYIGDQIPKLKWQWQGIQRQQRGWQKEVLWAQLIAEERAKELVCTRWLYLQQYTMCGQERNLRVFQKSTRPTTVIAKVITQEDILRTSQRSEIRLLSSVRITIEELRLEDV
ncbi:hypothetical protein BC332_30894 [Capsicum chinense]|nr:hypothetical protein BC332_30894 [Capsicum chinense]